MGADTQPQTNGQAAPTPASDTTSTTPQQPPPKPNRPPRPKKPNYAHLHRNPLPLKTHSLPPLHPTNPLSLLQYLYTYLSHVLSPPSSHPSVPYTAYFSPSTRSVHVTDPATVRALWEMGFFGKGTLSRSEPSWVEREEARVRTRREGGGTAEEATRKRREERRGFKMERARVEAERVRVQRLVEEGKMPPEASQAVEGEEAKVFGGAQAVAGAEIAKPDGDLERGMEIKAQAQGRVQDADLVVAPVLPEIQVTGDNGTDVTPPDLIPPPAPIENQEHLQLNLEEAFFLSFGLGVLAILPSPPQTTSPTSVTTTDEPLMPRDALALFAAHSTFPPSPLLSSPAIMDPTNPFLMSYIPYHHYRSLGWVVRPGTKFGVDYLLYNRGPVFSHAEFGVIVLPSYTHLYWSTDEGKALRQQGRDSGKEGKGGFGAKEGIAGREDMGWWWLHCVSRVQSQVKKTLVLCYVEVPPPGASGEGVKGVLERYKVRDFVMRRWLMNRSRG